MIRTHITIPFRNISIFPAKRTSSFPIGSLLIIRACDHFFDITSLSKTFFRDCTCSEHTWNFTIQTSTLWLFLFDCLSTETKDGTIIDKDTKDKSHYCIVYTSSRRLLYLGYIPSLKFPIVKTSFVCFYPYSPKYRHIKRTVITRT